MHFSNLKKIDNKLIQQANGEIEPQTRYKKQSIIKELVKIDK